VGDSGATLGNYSDSAGEAKLYGALLTNQLRADADADRLAKRRLRVNCVPLLLALLVPWAMFLIAYGAVSFDGHYSQPMLVWTGVVLVLLVSGNFLVSQLRSKMSLESRFWPLYFGVSCFFAVVFGVFLGEINFWQWMHPVYEINHLATYNNVNPSSQTTVYGEVIPAQGGRYQDAGMIYFTHDAVVDTTRSMSFKMGDLYCVAPIITPGCNASCGMDFWAVGVNCCSEAAADFRCGEFSNPKAKSGIRMVSASTRPLYRLAVLQAVGEHDIDSTQHPIFLTWVQDPIAVVHSWERGGYKMFVVLMVFSFGMNAFALYMYVAHIGRTLFGLALRLK